MSAEQSRPEYRPSERFWPYVDLHETPTEEEFAALDPDLHDALFGPTARPFSITLSFPRFEGDDYARAVELAKLGGEGLQIALDVCLLGHGLHRARLPTLEAWPSNAECRMQNAE